MRGTKLSGTVDEKQLHAVPGQFLGLAQSFAQSFSEIAQNRKFGIFQKSYWNKAKEPQIIKIHGSKVGAAGQIRTADLILTN